MYMHFVSPDERALRWRLQLGVVAGVDSCGFERRSIEDFTRSVKWSSGEATGGIGIGSRNLVFEH